MDCSRPCVFFSRAGRINQVHYRYLRALVLTGRGTPKGWASLSTLHKVSTPTSTSFPPTKSHPQLHDPTTQGQIHLNIPNSNANLTLEYQYQHQRHQQQRRPSQLNFGGSSCDRLRFHWVVWDLSRASLTCVNCTSQVSNCSFMSTCEKIRSLTHFLIHTHTPTHLCCLENGPNREVKLHVHCDRLVSAKGAELGSRKILVHWK